MFCCLSLASLLKRNNFAPLWAPDHAAKLKNHWTALTYKTCITHKRYKSHDTKIVSNLFHMKHIISEAHSQRQRYAFESMWDTRKKEQWHFCKSCALIVNDLESSLFLKQTFSKSLMAYSSIHLLHCKFFEVQVACNVMLQQLMKILISLALSHPFEWLKRVIILNFPSKQ